MMADISWAAGVDIGGTKIKVIQVNTSGSIGEQVQYPTDVTGGPTAITQEIVDAIEELTTKIGTKPIAVGIGVAGQVDGKTGVVKFAPNLKWTNVPLSSDINQALDIPVVTTNDVRAATWGEWLHGAGKGCDDVLCVFVGTGVGGGIVSAGQMLEGFNNTAGEIGHVTVSLDGPKCTCGNWGCMEAYAGGWAIAKRANDAICSAPDQGNAILEIAGGDVDTVKGMHVMEAASKGDALANQVINQAVDAIAAGVSGLVNSISPECIIFGGGVIEGSPWLIERIEPKIRERSLNAAIEGLTVTRAKLHNDAGAIGAAALAIKTYTDHQ
jgi:glucokinase